MGTSVLGRKLLLTIVQHDVSVYTLGREVVGVAGLEFSESSVKFVQLVSESDIVIDLYLAEVGVTKPRPRSIGVLCAECGTILLGRRNFVRHTKLHTIGVLQCKYCKEAFKDQFYLQDHSPSCSFTAVPFNKKTVILNPSPEKQSMHMLQDTTVTRILSELLEEEKK